MSQTKPAMLKKVKVREVCSTSMRSVAVRSLCSLHNRAFQSKAARWPCSPRAGPSSKDYRTISSKRWHIASAHSRRSQSCSCGRVFSDEGSVNSKMTCPQPGFGQEVRVVNKATSEMQKGRAGATENHSSASGLA